MSEEDTSQNSAPATEPTASPHEEEILAPTETASPEASQSTPETQPASPEPVPNPETAQMGRSEPLPPKPEPIAPEPPSAVASIPAPSHFIRDLLNKARVAIQDRKRKKRDKIMQALAKKNHVTNDEVEKLLHISDATATRYLSALEKEGKIKQVGKTGAGVTYSKV